MRPVKQKVIFSLLHLIQINSGPVGSELMWIKRKSGQSKRKGFDIPREQVKVKNKYMKERLVKEKKERRMFWLQGNCQDAEKEV